MCSCRPYACRSQATTVVFDKTGTLTTGKPAITGVMSIEKGWDSDRVSFGSLLGISPTQQALCVSVRCVLHVPAYQHTLFEKIPSSLSIKDNSVARECNHIGGRLALAGC